MAPTDNVRRAALFPARAAARAWRDQLEDAADEVLATPEFARVLDRALAGPLPEEIARSIVRHRVLERVAAELAASGELDRLIAAVLTSDETQRAMRELAATQTVGLAEEVLGGVRASAARLDGRAEHAVSRLTRDRPIYGGIVTRALALATDAVVAIALYLSVVGVVALVASLAGGLRPDWLVGTLLSGGWFVLAGTYFVLFWSTAGRTPGMHLLHLRLRTYAGAPPSVARSAVRLVGLLVSIAVLFLGFVPVLFDGRRRGLADFLAGTVVVYDN